MVELMGLEAGEMRLVEGGELVLQTHYGVSPDFVVREKAVPLGHCLCGVCAQTGETFVINDLATEPSLADSACSREGFHSILTTPMKANGRMIGVL